MVEAAAGVAVALVASRGSRAIVVQMVVFAVDVLYWIELCVYGVWVDVDLGSIHHISSFGFVIASTM